jgi:ubiquinone/menaquinone biosynthesis C-methylase UbiE
MNIVRTKGFGKYYDTIGSYCFYQSFLLDTNTTYNNPHSKKFNYIICKILKHITINDYPILDLSAGSGQITKELQQLKTLSNEIIGCDPYLFEQYKKATGNKCHQYTFDDIICGNAINFPQQLSIVFCSYALHLCNNIDSLLNFFSTKSKYFCIFSPNGHNLQNIKGYIVDWQFKHKNIKIYLLKSIMI